MRLFSADLSKGKLFPRVEDRDILNVCNQLHCNDDSSFSIPNPLFLNSNHPNLVFMKAIFLAIIGGIFLLNANAQSTASSVSKPDSTKKILTVEASCGECQFHMAGKGCELAVRIDGKSYFVDGTKIDDHGDAHGKDGFCEAIRKAEVQGEIVNNRFKATYFRLIPVKKGM